jgi:hypothetical protein
MFCGSCAGKLKQEIPTMKVKNLPCHLCGEVQYSNVKVPFLFGEQVMKQFDGSNS